MFSVFRPALVRGAVAAAAVTASAMPASAQQRDRVTHVITKATVAHLWLHVSSQVVADLQPGASVDVLDKDGDWLWVIVPPDVNGTRRAGWVRADTVGTVVVRPAAAPSSDAGDERAASAAAPETASSADDKVTISVAETHGDVTPSPAAATATVSFDDLHFDRNRSTLRADERTALDRVVSALQADPSLTVDIEGHTCNLGTAAYNQALGLRRANAVKHYLVGAGIAESRLHTSSMGQANPQYDNSREETRKLNRRVALVPEPRR